CPRLEAVYGVQRRPSTDTSYTGLLLLSVIVTRVSLLRHSTPLMFASCGAGSVVGRVSATAPSSSVTPAVTSSPSATTAARVPSGEMRRSDIPGCGPNALTSTRSIFHPDSPSTARTTSCPSTEVHSSSASLQEGLLM